MRHACYAATLASALLAPAAAHAQGAGSQAEAQALFDAGRKLMDAGKYAEACPKLEASQKLDPGAGTLLNLASCYEKNGQTASAWVSYTDAATASSASGHADWAAKAKARVDALAPHLPRLVLSMKTVPDGVEIKRDGKPIALGALNTSLPVDPGEHVIDVAAPGKNPWRSRVTAKADETAQVDVPALEDAQATGGAATPAPAPARGGAQRVLGLVLAGVGVAGVGVGSAFGIDAASKKDVATDPRYCLPVPGGPTHCNQQGADTLDGARTSATISTIAIVAGGVLVAGGLVLFFTAPKSPAEAKTAVRLVPAPGGLVLAGAF